MAHSKKFKEEKISTKRSDRFSEEFTIPLGRIRDFYRVVSILNADLGHGNWTTVGRPLRKLRRVAGYNSRRWLFPNFKSRNIDIVFRVPSGSEAIATRLLLELPR